MDVQSICVKLFNFYGIIPKIEATYESGNSTTLRIPMKNSIGFYSIQCLIKVCEEEQVKVRIVFDEDNPHLLFIPKGAKDIYEEQDD